VRLLEVWENGAAVPGAVGGPGKPALPGKQCTAPSLDEQGPCPELRRGRRPLTWDSINNLRINGETEKRNVAATVAASFSSGNFGDADRPGQSHILTNVAEHYGENPTCFVTSVNSEYSTFKRVSCPPTRTPDHSSPQEICQNCTSRQQPRNGELAQNMPLRVELCT
jgi:hypothetical protein